MITKLRLPKIISSLNPGIGINNFYSEEFNSGIRSKSREQFNDNEKMEVVVEGQSSDLSIDEFCAAKGISTESFNEWSKMFLNARDTEEIDVSKFEKKPEYKFRCVLEGRSGQLSISEICRREGITKETFLDWCQEFLNLQNRESLAFKLKSPVYKINRKLLLSSLSLNVVNYLENYIDISSEGLFVEPAKEIESDKELTDVDSFVSSKKLNDVRYINKYLEAVNERVNMGTVFVGSFETFSARKERLRINRIPFLNNLYFFLEFIVKRVLPKISLTKKYYFDFTKGHDRLLSKAEGLGRLVSCGFKIMDYESIDGIIYFVVKKVKKPVYDMNPSYGPVYKMPRLGRNGKIIGVYKFRTMHPYSEYLQDYMIKSYGYSNSGKPANDFRIPSWGKLMRKFWLDELPQLVNVFKGEMKLVGIRPVSKRYFEDIPMGMRKLRLSQKPGCIPPYVSLDRSGNVMSVLQSERQYLEEKIRSPYTTDTKYFFKAIFNIIFKNKRSA